VATDDDHAEKTSLIADVDDALTDTSIEQQVEPSEAPAPPPFDFDAHRRKAVDGYEAVRDGYAECAEAVRLVLKTVLDVEKINVLSIEARAKEVDSFGEKAITPSDDDPAKPKYPDPLLEITDLAGARVITYLLADVERVNTLVEREFEIVEKSTKSGLFGEGQKLGYQSVHFLVRFLPNRYALPEYERFKGRITEIQVRTVLQHGWAEIEHDIQYKALSTIPDSIRRRFMSLAGLLEIADREFQAISTEDQEERTNARKLLAKGKLDAVEITADALHAYLDGKLGPDERISDWSYEWAARLVQRLGLANIAEVDAAISPYDDDRISRLLWGSRQGQVSRFEDVLLAALGDRFVARRSPRSPGWESYLRRRLHRLERAGVEVGTYHDSTAPDSPPT
jgi:ppGpp synthetase/RelA/SpoT-type nucleotidyltranferase